MKASDLKTKTPDELKDRLADLKKEQFNLRFQASSGQLSNTARVRDVRRGIAQVKTIMAQSAESAKSAAAGKA
jgi:large subunit ribosomal protein L29